MTPCMTAAAWTPPSCSLRHSQPTMGENNDLYCRAGTSGTVVAGCRHWAGYLSPNQRRGGTVTRTRR